MVPGNQGNPTKAVRKRSLARNTAVAKSANDPTRAA
jgi:hypothetical protein